MRTEIETDTHVAIGPLADTYGHGPLTIIGDIYACLDCGYVAADNRLFAHTECDREQNPINQSWREYLDAEGPLDNALPTRDPDKDWPVE